MNEDIQDIVNQEIDWFIMEYSQLPEKIEMSSEDWQSLLKFYGFNNQEIIKENRKQYFRGIEVSVNDFMENERFVLYK